MARSMQGVSRWLAALALLGGAWLLSPGAVPLYDGIGFPDEPYRFVPQQGSLPPATIAEVKLRVAKGANVGGVLANSKEVGPQISLFVPPQGLLVASPSAREVVVTATAVPLTGAAPPGVAQSNVYDVKFASGGSAVTLNPAAQKLGVTMRAVGVSNPLPVMFYRDADTATWQELRTRRVGRDLFNAAGPGSGQYVLTADKAPPAASKSSGRGGLYLVLGLTGTLMAGVLLGVRLAARNQAPAKTSTRGRRA